MTIETTRRGFMATGSGLLLSLTLPLGAAAAKTGEAAVAGFEPNAFIRIGTDHSVTVLVKHLEMGQGPYTGLTTLVAEELDANWDQMQAVGAPANTPLYANGALGVQGTGGSTSMMSSFLPMREAAAAARQMLITAAAAEWGVPADEIVIKAGILSHQGTGKNAGFGDFAEAASKLPVPDAPKLKDPKDFVFIGKDRPRLDTASKVNGSAKFTLDHYPEGMLVVMVAHAPKFGAVVKSFDDTEALAVAGVEMVRQVPMGVAVYARNTWAAMKGREALVIEWDESKAEIRSSDAIFADYAKAAAEGGLTVEETGDLAEAFKGAEKVLEAEYRLPYLAHAPLEALDAIIEIKEGKAVLTYGCQFPTVDQMAFAGTFGIEPSDVTINVLMAGGSFGRRAQGSAHFAIEMAEVAKAAGRDGVFKLQWTREDDIRGGHYRPAALHKMRAGLDKDGKIVAWENVIATQSIMMGTVMEPSLNGGPDPFTFEGSAHLAYDLGTRRIGWSAMQTDVSVLWWRSVGHSHTAYAVETFLDEVLEAAGKDAIEGRLELLSAEATRERAVIEKVREISGWKGRKGENGKAYGFAFVKSFGSYVAQVAEVEDKDGLPRVTRVWVAVDCGLAVNPNLITAQCEGGVGFALSTALYSEITLAEGGEVEQSNYHDYPLLRITEMPAVEVAIIASNEAPSGIGEPPVPPLAPAVGNAWRQLTGRTKRQLPFARAEA
ncbi:molybdopterin cofactor-binding domain-containing protein [Falsigemmobacter intermedius]|uniref:Xanthine dehydrogenase family protein molybdopterin-binding subunit n=1 Tax=Falsigemmobacter intermedius TaxID=1553448 RepID=A0A3S3YJW7_9RHOB|nr:xanthine dehydrogenase family protein molybdopterin-binding subunit [Falsigemmobacter intermedius]RWY44769.1 xanthine dehydrogenase family protein molybdopterin-binding subunit [Falsigemmobacter intermedius]